MTEDQISLASVAASPSGAWPQPPISWAAIWAGASVAVATALVLTLAGAGLGYNLGYPGLASRGSLAAFTPTLGAGSMIVQVLSAALGGYVAGRLRTIWVGLHDHESHFRDTAHGLIAWAVATVGGTLLTAMVVAPYLDQLQVIAAVAPPLPPTAAELERAANIAAQSSLFLAIGMLLSAFVAAVAARIGGMQHEHMHAKGR